MKKSDYIKAWQERVGAETCHLDYGDVLKRKDLEKMFQQAIAGEQLEDCTVLDYGCGGGLLGEYLFGKFDLGGYAGADICLRAVDRAIKRLSDIQGATELYSIQLVDPFAPNITKEFDYIFCLNVLQHMPEKEYLDKLLDVFNLSGAKKIILNFRNGETVDFCPAPYKTTHEINIANTLTIEYINKRLPNYKKVRQNKKKNNSFVMAAYECR